MHGSCCCTSLKMLLLLGFLALPSIFAYGSRPENYSAKGGEQKPAFSQVNYWEKLHTNMLNRARIPNSEAALCYSPATNSGLFTDCRPFQSHEFPAANAVCRCSKCNHVSFKLLCYEGSWYLNPETQDFPCDNCDAQCKVQGLRNFKCADSSVGKLGEKRKFTCSEDCMEHVLECSSKSTWIQSVPEDGSPIYQCSAEPKTVYLQDKDMEYRKGLIKVQCKDGYKTQGPTAVACQNGQLNASLPQCLPQNPGFGGIGQGYVDGDVDGNNPFFPSKPYNPSSNNNPNSNKNPNLNPNNPSGGYNPNNPSGGNNPSFNNNPNSNPNKPSSGYNPNNPSGSYNPNNPSSNNNPNSNNPSGGYNPSSNNNPGWGYDPSLDDTTPHYLDDHTLLHLPSTKGPRGPAHGSDPLAAPRPTSALVTGTQPKGRNFNYLYVLYAALAIIAVVVVVVLIFVWHKHRRPAEALIETGVASGDHQAAKDTHGSYASKK